MSNIEPRASRPPYIRRHWLMLSIFGVLSIAAIAAGHVAGFILALACWFVFFMVLLGVKIFTGGTRYIARTQFDEQEKLRAARDAREREVPPGYSPPPFDESHRQTRHYPPL